MQVKTSITDNSNINQQKTYTHDLLKFKRDTAKFDSFPICDKAVTKFNHALVDYMGFQSLSKITNETSNFITVLWGKIELKFSLKTLTNSKYKIVSFHHV